MKHAVLCAHSAVLSQCVRVHVCPFLALSRSLHDSVFGSTKCFRTYISHICLSGFAYMHTASLYLFSLCHHFSTLAHFRCTLLNKLYVRFVLTKCIVCQWRHLSVNTVCCYKTMQAVQEEDEKKRCLCGELDPRRGVFKLIFWRPNAICTSQHSLFNIIFIKRAFLQLDEINSKGNYLVSLPIFFSFLFFISRFLSVSNAKCQKKSTPSLVNEWMNEKNALDSQSTRSTDWN